jgi:predicted amidohydrolase YtcJ
MDAARTRAEAVAVADGRIVAVGSDAALADYVGAETEVVDLAGGTLLPAFHDSHVHPVYGGVASLWCSLEEETSVEAIRAKLVECASLEAEPGDWFRGSLWDLAAFPAGNAPKELLDEILPDRPAYLMGADGHSAWVNSRALEIAGIDRSTRAPALGVIERDPRTGEPSGTLREAAMELVSRHLPAVTEEQHREGLRRAVRMANGFGITAWVDPGVGEAYLDTYRALDRSGELTVRSRVAVEFGTTLVNDAGGGEALLERRAEWESDRVDTDSVKLYIDGVLEGQTAALMEPYLGGDERNVGSLNFTPDRLKDLVTRFDAEGLQVHMHAIGDRAVRVALDAVEAARRANGQRDNRHYLAHLQLIDEADIPRFASLDVGASFQAFWAYPETYITKINLPEVGAERVERMYPIGSVERAGGRILGGSDWDVSSMNPLLAIQTALTREDPLGVVPGVLNAAERVDLDTMLAAYTINGAWGMHAEERTGSIEVGKLADLVVLDADLFAIPSDDIASARVQRTFLAGKTVYRADRD